MWQNFTRMTVFMVRILSASSVRKSSDRNLTKLFGTQIEHASFSVFLADELLSLAFGSICLLECFWAPNLWISRAKCELFCWFFLNFFVSSFGIFWQFFVPFWKKSFFSVPWTYFFTYVFNRDLQNLCVKEGLLDTKLWWDLKITKTQGPGFSQESYLTSKV